MCVVRRRLHGEWSAVVWHGGGSRDRLHSLPSELLAERSGRLLESKLAAGQWILASCR